MMGVVQAPCEFVNLSVTWELVKGGLHSPVVGLLSPSTPRVGSVFKHAVRSMLVHV